MKVQELIARLSTLPPDTEIHFEGDEDDELLDTLLPFPYDLEINIIETSWELLPLKDSE